MCIILASRREESHLYSFQVIKDLAVSTPHPWLQRHFEGTDRRDPLNVGLTILLYEFSQILGNTYRSTENNTQFGPVVHANMAQAAQISKEMYEAAIAQRPREIAAIREVFQDVDAFLTPTHPFVAPPLTMDAEGNPGVRQCTVPVSFTGFPALSLPCGMSSSGLPIGLQLVANDFQEALLFSIAGAFERVTDFHARQPPIYGGGQT